MSSQSSRSPVGKKYAALRTLMRKEDIPADYVQEVVGISRWELSRKLNGHKEWKLSEVYGICKMLRIPYEEIAAYFPESPSASASSI